MASALPATVGASTQQRMTTSRPAERLRPLAIRTTSGQRREVRGLPADASIGDIGVALGIVTDPGRPLLVDGQCFAGSTPAQRSGLRHGSSITVAPASCETDSRGDRAAAEIRLVCSAGPAAGASWTLGPGRVILGRSHAAHVRIDDRCLEPHHLALDVGAAEMRVVHLSGAVPVVCSDGTIGPGDVVEVGSSRLEVAPPAPRDAAANPLVDPGVDPWRIVHHRPPRAPAPAAVAPVQAPSPRDHEPPEGAGGLAASLLGLVGSAALAVVMGQPMFLAFGAVGAFVGVGGWIAMRCSRRRQRARARRRDAEEIDRFVAQLTVAHQRLRDLHAWSTPDLASCLELIERGDGQLWERRDRAFTVGIGVGDVPSGLMVADDGRADAGRPWAAEIERRAVLHDAVVAASLGPGTVVGIAGPSDAVEGVCRALLVQLAATHGPCDWELAACVRDASRWQWASWLPHAGAGFPCGADDDRAMADVSSDEGGRHLVVVTDRPDLLQRRASPLRRLVEARHACVIVLANEGSALPAATTSMLQIGSRSRGRWFGDVARPGLPTVVHTAGLAAASALSAAAILARYIDPELPGAMACFPDEVGLVELAMPGGIGVHDVVDRWAAHRASDRVVATLGVALDGVVEIDLDRDGPHALVGGTTGSGKSELLRTFVASLALCRSPDEVSFVLVDYKGGATFDACAALPHVVGVVTDLDEHLAERVLRSFEAELRRREAVLRALGAADLVSARRAGGANAAEGLARLVVVVDEFAVLATEHPQFLGSLVDIAQRGRSLGVHLVLATQRPGGVVDDDIRANTSIRIALRVQAGADSTDVIGVPDAARLPRRAPGRAVLRLGGDELIEWQAARVTAPFADGASATPGAEHDGGAGHGRSELDVIVAAICAAADVAGCGRPRAPWMPPLPSTLDRADVPAGAVGLIDLPDAQAQRPLRWDPATGSLLLCGSAGSGLTSTMMTIVAGLARQHTPEGLHVYVIDGHGDARLALLTALPHCGAVVGLHEHERLRRTLSHVARTAARRASGCEPGGGPQVVLVIDGLEALRTALDDDAGRGIAESPLVRILEIGAAHGVTTIAGTRSVGAVPAHVVAHFTHRWLFHLGDRHEAVVLGLPARDVPPPIAGRCAVTPSGAQAQVVRPPSAAEVRGLGTGRGAHSATRVETLPSRVPPAAVCTAESQVVDYEDDRALLIGLAYADGTPAWLTVPPPGRICVVGPAGSGRSSVLLRVASAWAASQPDAAIHVVAPRRSPLRTAPWTWSRGLPEIRAASAPTLLVIDDAETIDDAEGVLAHALSDPRSAITVAIASRPDAVRALGVHWSAAVRRARRGIVLTGGCDLDGDALGVVLPRRLPWPAPPDLARPGLGWIVGDGEPVLAQVALDELETRPFDSTNAA